MNSNQMKNIIVLKNLPSNLIDEAFIILKNNKKIKSLERIEKKPSNQMEKSQKGEYIVKEAEMVISSYMSKIENEKQIKSYSMKKIENKYKKMRGIAIILSLVVFINLIIMSSILSPAIALNAGTELILGILKVATENPINPKTPIIIYPTIPSIPQSLIIKLIIYPMTTPTIVYINAFVENTTNILDSPFVFLGTLYVPICQPPI